jgi:3-hydroxyacyl-CoA dehydrogenase/enoyl-CoA hydratase/3-hydroxybutyryl-CoA epimerase
MNAPLVLDVQPNGIAWLVLDVPDARVNVLSGAVLDLLDRVLDDAADRQDIRAVAVISGKPGTFIAGADVGEIGAITERDKGVEAARRGQSILAGAAGQTHWRPSMVPAGGGSSCWPVTPAITDIPATKLGPPRCAWASSGLGGSQRLPRLVARPRRSTSSGRQQVDGRKAARLGLVDRVVPVALLRNQAEAWLLHALTHARKGHPWARLKPRRRLPLGQRLMSSAPVRPFVLALARRQLNRTLQGVYPAPYAALHAIDLAFHTKLDTGLDGEARLVGPLLLTPTCKNLTWLFGANNEARKDQAAPARPVRHAVVLGAGVMGGGIAHLLAEQSIPVRMKDVNEAALARGMAAAADLVRKQLARRRIDRREAARRMARIAPTLTYDGFRGADIVIEAWRISAERAVLPSVRPPWARPVRTNTPHCPSTIAAEAATSAWWGCTSSTRCT